MRAFTIAKGHLSQCVIFPISLTSWVKYSKKTYDLKIAASTLNKGIAFVVIMNSASQIERWGFVFKLTIRYHNIDYSSHNGKKSVLFIISVRNLQ